MMILEYKTKRYKGYVIEFIVQGKKKYWYVYGHRSFKTLKDAKNAIKLGDL